MGTGAETQEETNGASQSRDVIPKLCFSCAHLVIVSNSKAIATLPTWGQFFSNFKSDIWHIKYLANPNRLQRCHMVRCINRLGPGHAGEIGVKQPSISQAYSE
jgi:hypothetical protein